MLTDTHAHLFWETFKQSSPTNDGKWDFYEVLQRAVDAGVSEIVNVGVDPVSSQAAADLNTDKLKFYSTIGIHPHEAIKYLTETKAFINRDMRILEDIYYKNPQKVIGVGECGLDLFFSSDPNWAVKNAAGSGISSLSVAQLQNVQILLFQAQIGLAKRLDLPLIVHCRDDRTKDPANIDAWKLCLERIKDWKGILHCYSGTAAVTQVIPPGFLVSFAGNITYPQNGYLREAVKNLPLEKIVLETDCPFLAPQSKRGQRNEPSTVREIAELIAQLKGVSFEQVAQQTTQNVKNLFKI